MGGGTEGPFTIRLGQRRPLEVTTPKLPGKACSRRRRLRVGSVVGLTKREITKKDDVGDPLKTERGKKLKKVTFTHGEKEGKRGFCDFASSRGETCSPKTKIITRETVPSPFGRLPKRKNPRKRGRGDHVVKKGAQGGGKEKKKG